MFIIGFFILVILVAAFNKPLRFVMMSSLILIYLLSSCAQELVTFSCHPLLKSPNVSNAGRHLSAAEFHSVIQHAGKCCFAF